MTRELAAPILDGGVENVHFFEGRLLTARDLRDEQRAQRRRDRLQGRALGAGVVEGLEVTVAVAGDGSRRPELAVSAGLAINPRGDALELPAGDTVALVRETPRPAGDGTLFDDCADPPARRVPTGVGVYVLVLSPALGFREAAPRVGLPSDREGGGRVVGCGRRYEVEGVQLRLEPLSASSLASASETTRREVQGLLGATGDLASRHRLRNLLAHLCFGTEALAGFAVDPFAESPVSARLSAVARRGALDDLRSLGALTDCDVPLALFVWTLRGIAFVDLWSVRRRPVPRGPSAAWPTLAGERFAAEAEARLLQFQGQLAELLAEHPDPAAIRARDHFRRLPPAGFLPLRGAGRRRGLDATAFLSGTTPREPSIVTEGARLHDLVLRSYPYPAIDLESPEMLWIYRVRENTLGPGPTAPGAPPFAVFASGFMPYFGRARFDVARWNLSNYELL